MKKAKGGSQYKSKQAGYSKTNYELYREKYITNSINRKKDIKKKFVEYKKDLQCKDCGNKDFRVLDFDHINNDKDDNVGNLVNMGCCWNTIMKEINKCEVVCSNCHRIRTYERRNAR
jgi:hypothetical protein